MHWQSRRRHCGMVWFSCWWREYQEVAQAWGGYGARLGRRSFLPSCQSCAVEGGMLALPSREALWWLHVQRLLCARSVGPVPVRPSPCTHPIVLHLGSGKLGHPAHSGTSCSPPDLRGQHLCQPAWLPVNVAPTVRLTLSQFCHHALQPPGGRAPSVAPCVGFMLLLPGMAVDAHQGSGWHPESAPVVLKQTWILFGGAGASREKVGGAGL